ncbi:MAG: VOC family protein [Chloroflexota bacterium]
MKIKRIDHVGIVVNDFDKVKAFFLDLGLEMMGEMDIEGEWVERIIGLQNVKEKVTMLQTPDGEATLELVKFYTPADENGIQSSLANTLGIRHIAFAVEDVEAIIEKLKPHGAEIVGEIQTYEDTYKLCYIRGPEGLILELAEKLNKV